MTCVGDGLMDVKDIVVRLVLGYYTRFQPSMPRAPVYFFAAYWLRYVSERDVIELLLLIGFALCWTQIATTC